MNSCATCFLWHVGKKYCSLDGKHHEGCIANYMPINGAKHGKDPV